jgi:hypothetical protein
VFLAMCLYTETNKVKFKISEMQGQRNQHDLAIFPTTSLEMRKKFPTRCFPEKDEAFKTVCFKSLKALFSVEADKPIL